MRNPDYVLENLRKQACKEDYKFDRLYRNLYNLDFYLEAYSNIARSQGSMTAGADGMTLDDMSIPRIERLIGKLKDHSYQPHPARREYIDKKNDPGRMGEQFAKRTTNPSKKRPLGIPSTDDKLVQEIVRMILEAIYEPTFSPRSHGFRPKRSCHTALAQVKMTFEGAKWIVEGDIKACFDSFDHHVLVDILRERIKDEYFIALIWKMLRAGYMEQWTYHDTYSGTPQGSGCSPILANIYLNELDKFMAAYKPEFDIQTAEKRKPTYEYQRIVSKSYKRAVKAKKLQFSGDKAKRRLVIREIKTLQQSRLHIPAYPVFDHDYRKLQYNRYADDFVIGVIGSKQDAQKVKDDVRDFLQNRLKLTLSEEKTKVTHSSEFVRYLGYDFSVSRVKDTKRGKDGKLYRCWYGAVKLYVPHEKWLGKLLEYKALKISKDKSGKERWKALHRGFLVNRDNLAIVSKYNAEIRGIYNFYWLAENATVLNDFYYIMKGSMYRTFAAKYKSTFKKMAAKYEVNGVFTVEYETKSGTRYREFYRDGFKQKDEMLFEDIDTLPEYRVHHQPSSSASRLKAGICEMCGKQSQLIHMRHVKRLKDLTGKDELESLMLKKRRKSLALCSDCFEKSRLNPKL
jgi:group II intron reverse transcriptase/maturase